jgi:type IV secretion system protein TrbG
MSLLVRPTRSGLKTNLVLTTNLRTYLIQLTSIEKACIASVFWDWPKNHIFLQRQAPSTHVGAPVEEGLMLEKIRFRYIITGSNPPWKPLSVFTPTYLQW